MKATSTKSTVEICDFAGALLPAINELFLKHFTADDRLLTDQYSNWLYRENPFGRARLVFVPGSAGYLAFMALIPVMLARKDEQAKAYFVVNVLVDPKERGKNLFGKMIEAASGFAFSEDAILMGHPNASALKGWQRAGMQFHDELRPMLALPIGWNRSIQARTSTSLRAIERAVDSIGSGENSLGCWKVAASGAYLDWRYLRHPTNHYTLQLLKFGDGSEGVQAVKHIRFGTHLLMDQFTSAASIGRAFLVLPFPTLCFLPQESDRRPRASSFPLPLKKRIRVFATRFSRPMDSRDLQCLGLSPTDL